MVKTRFLYDVAASVVTEAVEVRGREEEVLLGKRRKGRLLRVAYSRPSPSGIARTVSLFILESSHLCANA